MEEKKEDKKNAGAIVFFLGLATLGAALFVRSVRARGEQEPVRDTHNVCVDGTCFEQRGVGRDECPIVGQDCEEPLECQEGEIREGSQFFCPAPNDNLIQSQEVCRDGQFVVEQVNVCPPPPGGQHRECRNGRCVLVPGDEPDQCQNDAECLPDLQCGVNFIVEGLGVTFSAEVQGGVLPIQYDWDFGDGVQDQGARVIHQYQEDGSYRFTLDVIDGNGRQCSFQGRVDVEAPLDLSRMAIIYSRGSNDAPQADILGRSLTNFYRGNDPDSIAPDVIAVRDFQQFRNLVPNYDVVVMVGAQCSWGIDRGICAPNPINDLGIWDALGFQDLGIPPPRFRIQRSQFRGVCVYNVAGFNAQDTADVIGCFAAQARFAVDDGLDPCNMDCRREIGGECIDVPC